MKLRLAALLAATVSCGPAFAEDAASGVYATVFAGGSFYTSVIEQTSIDPPMSGSSEMIMKPGLFVGGAVGALIHDNLRGEIELSYSSSSLAEMNGSAPPDDYDNSAFQFTALGNLWYDIDTGSGFTPYLGGGLGVGYSEFSDENDLNITSSGLVYQVGAGVRAAVADNVTLDLGYRYRVLHEASVEYADEPLEPGETALDTGTNHIVQVGLSFGF